MTSPCLRGIFRGRPSFLFDPESSMLCDPYSGRLEGSSSSGESCSLRSLRGRPRRRLPFGMFRSWLVGTCGMMMAISYLVPLLLPFHGFSFMISLSHKTITEIGVRSPFQLFIILRTLQTSWTSYKTVKPSAVHLGGYLEDGCALPTENLNCFSHCVIAFTALYDFEKNYATRFRTSHVHNQVGALNEVSQIRLGNHAVL